MDNKNEYTSRIQEEITKKIDPKLIEVVKKKGSVTADRNKVIKEIVSNFFIMSIGYLNVNHKFECAYGILYANINSE